MQPAVSVIWFTRTGEANYQFSPLFIFTAESDVAGGRGEANLIEFLNAKRKRG